MDNYILANTFSVLSGDCSFLPFGDVPVVKYKLFFGNNPGFKISDI